jgi:hypothetical protein
MKLILAMIVACLPACVVWSGYVVDVQLPGTNDVTTVTIDPKGTAEKAFDSQIEIPYGEPTGVGLHISVTNFVPKQHEAAIDVKIEYTALNGWQTNAPGIRTPILKMSGAATEWKSLYFNAWVALGGGMQMRIRETESQQTSCVNQMLMLWDCSRSESLVRSQPFDRLIGMSDLTNWFNPWLSPTCPTCGQEYPPFKVIDGPICPCGHQMPEDVRTRVRSKMRSIHDNNWGTKQPTTTTNQSASNAD